MLDQRNVGIIADYQPHLLFFRRYGSRQRYIYIHIGTGIHTIIDLDNYYEKNINTMNFG